MRAQGVADRVGEWGMNEMGRGGEFVVGGGESERMDEILLLLGVARGWMDGWMDGAWRKNGKDEK